MWGFGTNLDKITHDPVRFMGVSCKFLDGYTKFMVREKLFHVM